MAKNIFNSISLRKPKSNTFDMSYDVKMTLNMGELVPTHCQEILPGDIINMSTESMLRFAPLIAPVMHKVDIYQHFFFVPNRLTWSGWEKFIVQDPDAGAFPYLTGFQNPVGSLGDYLGLPTTSGLSTLTAVSALPFAAYQRIYNEYYRDQNLQDEVASSLVDGNNSADITDLTTLRKRAWNHDYFTASLPFAQKGDPVTLPLGQFTDVDVEMVPGVTGVQDFRRNDVGNTDPAQGAVDIGFGGDLQDSAGNPIKFDPNGGLRAKTSELEAQAASINELRLAFRVQEWLEKNARGGTRYIESILAHFGVYSSDARLQRPQYLGGSIQPMVISEVLQTAPPVNDDSTPQANMAGHGISVGGGKAFRFRAEEHGYIIGIMSVMPKTAYQQGIPKHFLKGDPFDFYWPTFAHLGEQAVLNKELYYAPPGDPDFSTNNDTFGYVPRYSEYRYHDNRVAGDFRNSLSFWHLARIFTNRPNLNADFIECNPSSRIFAVTDPSVDKLYAHVFHRIKATRPIPKFGTPEF